MVFPHFEFNLIDVEQDEEVGDGTTSVIILAGLIERETSQIISWSPQMNSDPFPGEMLHVAEPLLERKLHPTVITQVS